MTRWQDFSEAVMQPWRQLAAVLVVSLPALAPAIDWGGKLAALAAALLLVRIQWRTAQIRSLERQKLEIEIAQLRETAHETGQ